MARRRFGSSVIRRASSPNRSWTAFVNTSASAVAASTKLLLGTFTQSNPGIDETVLRTVGSIAVYSDQTAAGESQIGAFGMIVVSDAAAAIGITAIPGPATDADDDGWFLYQPINQRMVVATAVGIDAQGAVNYGFDSKAKRRTESGETIAIVVENSSAAHGFNATVVLRLLSMVSGT